MNRYSTLILTCLMLFTSLGAFAQRPGMRQQNREKIQAARIAFITNRLELTPEQAQTFWPIFNEYEAKKQELTKKYNQQKRALAGEDGFRNMNEENATKMVDIYIEQKRAQLDLEEEYLKKFQTVIKPMQSWALIRANGQFTRDLMKRLRERGRGAQKRPGGDGN